MILPALHHSVLPLKFLKATYYIKSTHTFFLYLTENITCITFATSLKLYGQLFIILWIKSVLIWQNLFCNGMLYAEQDVIPLTEYSIKLQLYLRIYSKRMWVITFGVLCISHDEMASSHCLLLPRQTVDRPSSGCTLGTGKARVSFPAGGTAGPFKVKQSVMGVWSED